VGKPEMSDKKNLSILDKEREKTYLFGTMPLFRFLSSTLFFFLF